MSFKGAHGFVIHGAVTQVDMSGRGNEMKDLVRAACPSASHESAERGDPPRCHPNTRKEIMNEIMNWVNSSNQDKRIMWLTAAAGAGKSSIAQTIADMCSRDGTLLSTFFFSRTATGSGRDDGNRLIPTIAYHLSVSVPEARDVIMTEIERDPAIFQHSMDVQLKKLVMDPICDLLDREILHIPFVVIIDGLDECNSAPVQSRIISSIAKSISEISSSIRFFFTSRPEHEIRKAFDNPPVKNRTIKLSLNEDEKAYRDIEIYVKSEFYNLKKTHTLTTELLNDSHWPSNRDIWKLVNRSSGYFIYVSTAMKYISDDNHDPREALDAIIRRSMSIIPGEVGPFLELDALYIHILSTAASRTKGGYDALLSILQVLALIIDESILTSIGYFAKFLGITETVLTLRLMHLHSIIHIPSLSDMKSRLVAGRRNNSTSNTRIKFYHASFKDFLLDQSRSKKYFVDPAEGHIFMARRCLKLVQSENASTLESGTILRDAWNIPRTDPTGYAAKFLFYHLARGEFNIQRLNEVLHDVDLKLLMSVILNTVGGNGIEKSLSPIFSINFDRAGDFAIPKGDETVDICKRVSDALDEMVLEMFTDNDALVTFTNVIYYGVDSPHNFFCYWATKIMDIPERGRHIYISDEKAKHLVLSILNIPTETERGSQVLGIYQKNWPKVLQYLFERIKPSHEFVSDIKKYSSRLDWFLYIGLHLEPSSRESVEMILEECKLAKEIIEAANINHARAFGYHVSYQLLTEHGNSFAFF